MSWHKSLQIWRIRLKHFIFQVCLRSRNFISTGCGERLALWYCSAPSPGCCRPLQGAKVMQIYSQPWIYSFAHSRQRAKSPLWHCLHLLQEVRSNNTLQVRPHVNRDTWNRSFSTYLITSWLLCSPLSVTTDTIYGQCWLEPEDELEELKNQKLSPI